MKHTAPRQAYQHLPFLSFPLKHLRLQFKIQLTITKQELPCPAVIPILVQCSKHTCVLWLHLHALLTFSLFLVLALVLYWSKRIRFLALCLGYCSLHFNIWFEIVGVVRVEAWPACVTRVDNKHIMSIFSHVCKLNIKGLTLAQVGHSKVSTSPHHGVCFLRLFLLPPSLLPFLLFTHSPYAKLLKIYAAIDHLRGFCLSLYFSLLLIPHWVCLSSIHSLEADSEV